MAAGLVLTVAQTLFAALQCTELRELSSILGYESKLGDLKRTVILIKAVLLDADSKHQELTEAGCDWVEKLKDAVYDADDLFDELTTKAQQLKRMSGGKLYKKAHRFFSNDNQLLFGLNKSREIKQLRDKLNGIAEDHGNFGVNDEYKPIKRREETCSYVYETSIIGREEDKKKIVELLLSDNTCVKTQQNVSFASIVGMGGLGKTALAQLVFNDGRIKDAFGEDMYWVCVSEEFGLKEILSKLPKMNTEHTLQDLQEEILKRLGGKRYLIVLDDVWEESHYKWLELKRILGSGGFGSKILITTRSNKVAKSVDKDAAVYELKGLSDENSWQLFKSIAFGLGDVHDAHLVEIGKDIVKKCNNIPLSLKVTSSLLHNLDKSKWEEYRSRNLANMSCHGEKDLIMSTLMFSYYNLTPELKSCFSFCSLFPKDYEIEKELLISLWLAQGYLVPRHQGESMEDVGADYFCILLQRCFFQDVERDEYGEIISCKMHDLMHDLALKVAGKESLVLATSSEPHDFEQKLRHLSATRELPIDALSSNYCPSRKTLRTLFKLDRFSSINAATLNCKRLRVLHLGSCHMNSIPDNLGKFLHLRYLDLSYSYSLRILPRSTTKLYNLQILKLRKCHNLTELPKDIGKLINLRILDIHGCSQLEELPKDIGKLVNLRNLDIDECSQLEELPEGIVELVNLRVLNMYRCDYLNKCNITYMPAGMDKLRNLHTLTYFVVGGDNSMQVQKGELIDLKGLICLRGNLCIKVGRFSQSNMPIATKGADILRKARLKGLEVICGYENGYFVGPFDQGEYHEILLEGLHSNDDLSTLVIIGYQGIKFPNWGLGKVTFPTYIVKMELSNCVGLKHLSSVSKLVCLKYLEIYRMENLECIEHNTPCDVSETFFPSLEDLIVEWVINLKGLWKDITWKEKEVGNNGSLVDANGNMVDILPSFTCLHHLRITSCESLKYFPPCPHLKKLHIARVNEVFTFCMKKSIYFHPSLVMNTTLSTSSSSNLMSTGPTLFCLEKLVIEDVKVFNTLFHESFLGSVEIEISSFFSVKKLWEIREVFRRCASSVFHLSIQSCGFLSLDGGGINYLTNLQSLQIKECCNLESLDKDIDGMPWQSPGSLSSLNLLRLPKLIKLPWKSLGEDDKDMMPWKSLHSLSSLELIKLPKLVKLPKDFQYLSSLRSLRIEKCDNLEGLGEFFGSLTSLQTLHIKWCPKLKSLPEAMGHLTSLTQLLILHSSGDELKERCQKPDGEDWPKICHIPNLEITQTWF